MTVAIRIAGIAHTPLATHPRVASPHDSPSAEGGGSYRRGLVIVHHCGRSPCLLHAQLRAERWSPSALRFTLIPPHSRASSCFPF